MFLAVVVERRRRQKHSERGMRRKYPSAICARITDRGPGLGNDAKKDRQRITKPLGAERASRPAAGLPDCCWCRSYFPHDDLTKFARGVVHVYPRTLGTGKSVGESPFSLHVGGEPEKRKNREYASPNVDVEWAHVDGLTPHRGQRRKPGPAGPRPPDWRLGCSGCPKMHGWVGDRGPWPVGVPPTCAQRRTLKMSDGGPLRSSQTVRPPPRQITEHPTDRHMPRQRHFADGGWPCALCSERPAVSQNAGPDNAMSMRTMSNTCGRSLFLFPCQPVMRKELETSGASIGTAGSLPEEVWFADPGRRSLQQPQSVCGNLTPGGVGF